MGWVKCLTKEQIKEIDTLTLITRFGPPELFLCKDLRRHIGESYIANPYAAVRRNRYEWRDDLVVLLSINYQICSSMIMVIGGISLLIISITRLHMKYIPMISFLIWVCILGALD